VNRIVHVAAPLVAAIGIMAACSPSDGEHAASRDNTSESERRGKHGTNGDGVVALDVATQKLMGLQVEPLAAKELALETKAYGSVLDPTALSELVADLVSAQATAKAAKEELDRIRTLKEQNNASARALQAAEAAVAREQAAAAAARQKLLAHWGSAITRRSDLEIFVQSLAAGEMSLVQLSLPAGQNLESQPASARLFSVSGEVVEGEFIGPAATVDPQLQGQGFFFVATNHGVHLKPGAAVTGWLKLSGEPVAGVVVPESAIVRSGEKTWVFLQTAGTNFTRTQVVLNQRIDNQNSWLATEGLKPGDRIVVQGAQSLLSEEQKSMIQLED
jgi:hypothetical protein